MQRKGREIVPVLRAYYLLLRLMTQFFNQAGSVSFVYCCEATEVFIHSFSACGCVNRWRKRGANAGSLFGGQNAPNVLCIRALSHAAERGHHFVCRKISHTKRDFFRA